MMQRVQIDGIYDHPLWVKMSTDKHQRHLQDKKAPKQADHKVEIVHKESRLDGLKRSSLFHEANHWKSG